MIDIRWKHESPRPWASDALTADVSPVVALITVPHSGMRRSWAWGVLLYSSPDADRQVGHKLWAADGVCRTQREAKLAAVEAWRKWAREQAEAAGFVLATPS